MNASKSPWHIFSLFLEQESSNLPLPLPQESTFFDALQFNLSEVLHGLPFVQQQELDLLTFYRDLPSCRNQASSSYRDLPSLCQSWPSPSRMDPPLLWILFRKSALLFYMYLLSSLCHKRSPLLSCRDPPSLIRARPSASCTCPLASQGRKCPSPVCRYPPSFRLYILRLAYDIYRCFRSSPLIYTSQVVSHTYQSYRTCPLPYTSAFCRRIQISSKIATSSKICIQTHCRTTSVSFVLRFLSSRLKEWRQRARRSSVSRSLRFSFHLHTPIECNSFFRCFSQTFYRNLDPRISSDVSMFLFSSDSYRFLDHPSAVLLLSGKCPAVFPLADRIFFSGMFADPSGMVGPFDFFGCLYRNFVLS